MVRERLDNWCEKPVFISFILIFLMMATGMYAIYQLATNSEYVWLFIKAPVFRKRGSGTYNNPKHVAGFPGPLVAQGLANTSARRLGHLLRFSAGHASLFTSADKMITW